MLFNLDKCKCIHFGYGNMCYDYFLGSNLIASTLTEKDLGVLINQSLKPSAHCAEAVKKDQRRATKLITGLSQLLELSY